MWIRLHPNGGDVNGNAKYRFIQSPERLQSMGPLGRFFSKYILCQEATKDGARQREEDYRMRNVRRYLYNNAQTNYPQDGADGKHQRHASVSSDNFSSSRSDSWRVQNRCGIPLRMIEPRRRNSWAVTRKPSQDSNLSSSRNDSSATSNSTATWRLSRSSVSSDAASHSGGGKSSFKRIPQTPGGANTGGVASPNATVGGILAANRAKITLPTSTAAVAAAAAAAAVATGSAAGAELTGAGVPVNIGGGDAAANSDDEMAALTLTNTIQNQNPLPVGVISAATQQAYPRRKSSLSMVTAAAGAAGVTPVITKANKATKPGGKKRKKKKVKIKKPPKREVTIVRPPSASAPEIDNDDDIDDEEASAKIATNRPRLVRQSAFFSDEVVIEPEVCPVHGPLNPGTYDDEDDEDDDVSDLDGSDEDDDDEDDEEDDDDEDNHPGGVSSTGGGGVGVVLAAPAEEDEEEDIEDPTSPILRKPSGQPGIAGIALVIVPRRLSTVRGSRDESAELQQPFLRASGSSSSINNTSPNSGGASSSSPIGAAGPPLASSTNSPTALLLPAGMAHFGRRKMSEQPVKFYVVPATTGLLTSAKWHSMSCVDTNNTSPAPSGSSSPNQPRSPNYGGGASSTSPVSLRSQTQHSRSHSPRQFPRHEANSPNAGASGRRLSSSIAETLEETPVRDRDVVQEDLLGSPVLQRPPIRDALLNERRVSFQLPGINLPGGAPGAASLEYQQRSSPTSNVSPISSPPEATFSSHSSRRGSNS